MTVPHSPDPTTLSRDDDFITFYDLLAFAWNYRFVLALGIVFGLIGGVFISRLHASGYKTTVTINIFESENTNGLDSNALNRNLHNALSDVSLSRLLAATTIEKLAGDTRIVEALKTELAANETTFTELLAKQLRSGSSKPNPNAKFGVSIDFLDPDQIRVMVAMPRPGQSLIVAEAVARSVPKFLNVYNSNESETEQSNGFVADSSPIFERIFIYQRSVQQLMLETQMLKIDLNKTGKIEAPLVFRKSGDLAKATGLTDTTTFIALEIHDLRTYLASIALLIKPEMYDHFDKRLAELAAKQMILAASFSAIDLKQYTAESFSKNRFLPSADNATVLPVITPIATDMRQTKTLLFSLIGAIGGFLTSICIAVISRIAAQAQREIPKSKYAR